MAAQVSKRYLLGDCWLEPDTRLLTRGEQTLRLANLPFQILLYLIERRDYLVSRTELLEVFWQGSDVYDGTLTQCIGAVRRALDDRKDHPRFIETRWAGGYRYIGPLEEEFAELAPSVVEIERTRAVRIVVEEEIHDSESVAESLADAPASIAVSPAPRVKPTRRRLVWLSAGLLLFMLTGFALLNYSSRNHATATPAAPINSIAVLPLKNLTGDSTQEYFSAGLTEGFITELSKIKGLKVISRSSVFTFKGKEIDPREVGQMLGVAAIFWLEKSYREHSPDLSSIQEPMFDGLRSDPRFVDLATRVRP